MPWIDQSLLTVDVEITLRKGGVTRTYTGIKCQHTEFNTEFNDPLGVDDWMAEDPKPVEFVLHMHKPIQNSNGVWYAVQDISEAVPAPQEKHGA